MFSSVVELASVILVLWRCFDVVQLLLHQEQGHGKFSFVTSRQRQQQECLRMERKNLTARSWSRDCRWRSMQSHNWRTPNRKSSLCSLYCITSLCSVIGTDRYFCSRNFQYLIHNYTFSHWHQQRCKWDLRVWNRDESESLR